jgi:hypothetical protein
MLVYEYHLSSYASCIIPLNSTKNERKQNYRWVQKSVAQCTTRFNHLSPSLDLTTGPLYPKAHINYQSHVRKHRHHKDPIAKMPLYELFCIASHNPTSPVCPSPPFSSSHTRSRNEDQLTFQANLRQLVSSVSSVIHNNGGVVRDLKSLGKGVTLPMKFRANQAYHTHGE